MGNKLCKKKQDVVDSPKSTTPFDRIINRLHLHPNGWKSDTNLATKQANSYTTPLKKEKNGDIISNKKIRPLSNAKSSDWTEVALEVPSEKEEIVHKQNPELTQIFNHNGTPTPPPRKHKKGIREKIESVARNSMQAFQGNKKPVEEPPCTKKIINYGCPADDNHEKHHKQHNEPQHKNDKAAKRRKNLSVVSLPNYSDLKFSIAKSHDDDDAKINGTLRNSALALETRKTASSGKLENYMMRCRSFGSLLPQHFLDRFKPHRKTPADVESDDSFGPLEDWDLRIIEHYNPKDTSLPRPPKPIQRTEKDILLDVESLIVSNEEAVKPTPPVRRSESLLKKLNRKASESANIRKSNELLTKEHDIRTPTSITPPPSPEPKRVDKIPTISPEVPRITPGLTTQSQEEPVEHSSLLKILEDYSIKEKEAKHSIDDEPIPLIDEDVDEDRLVEEKVSSNLSSLTPSLVEFEKTITNTVEDFINTEKGCASKDLHFTKFGSLSLPQNAAPLKT